MIRTMTITNATLRNIAALAQSPIMQIPEQRPCFCCGGIYGVHTENGPRYITRGMQAHTAECWNQHSDPDYPGEWIA